MKVLTIIAGIVLCLYVTYQVLFPTYTHRYRLTIEVEVDGKIRSASSVIEVRISDQRSAPIGFQYDVDVSGEAVFLDLGKGRHVIAILGYGPTAQEGRHGPGSITRDVFDPLSGNNQIESLIATSKLPVGSKAQLVGSQIPAMVEFSNVNKRTSAQVIPIDSFQEVFGPTIRFHTARIEITSDAVTWGIEQKLPWITEMKRRGQLGLTTYPGRFEAYVPHFVRTK